MALSVPNREWFFMLLALATSQLAHAGDSDFIVPPNSTVDGSFFTFTGMRPVLASPPPKSFTVTKATMVEFPSLNGECVSYAVLMFPAGGINPPHTHPHSAEPLFLIEGSLNVGFVDTTKKLYTRTLQAGDMFVFPKGLVHYQLCNSQSLAIAVSAFGSENAGTVSIPGSVFATDIDDGILAKSFNTDIATIRKIKGGLAPKQ